MNSMLRATLDALFRLLAPETSGAPSTDRTFAEHQYVTPAWEHGHVPMSVDLFGALGRVLDARETSETLSAEQLSRIGPIGDSCSALSGRSRGQDSG